MLRETVTRFPAAIALDDGESPLSYRELDRRVTELAGRLRATGIGAGDRVGIRIASGGAELYVGVLAVLAAGAAYVPVDAEDPDERAELVWREAGVCAVLGAGGRA
ncbi:AMP-binding protein, partial [Streptomyces harbinensis]|uniref:AMP-binding protein n=1 Tax=Streptomyces harbinensis TaxID=1176198 RepID=UPI0034DEACE6